MFCSLTPVCVAVSKVKYIMWTGITIYTMIMLAMWIWSVVDFPGYVINDSFD